MTDLLEKLLSIQLPTQYIIENNSQVEKKLSWRDIFNIIKSKHWHKDGKFTCPHDESLYDHLCLCGKLSYEKALQLGYSEQDAIKVYFAGLLHDIGKPGTQKIIGKYTSFKGHGLVGGGLIENFWSDEIEKTFGLTREDWGDISMLADVHMCGYFPDQQSDTHKFCFQILPYNIKKLLVCVRHGDLCSMTPSADYKQTKEDIFNHTTKTEQDFVDMLYLEPKYDEYLKTNKLGQGILIQMCGSSSCGKSYIANKISTHLNSIGVKTIIVNRDKYMVKSSMNMMGNRFNITDEISPELYNKCYNFYLSKNKSYAGKINESMRDDITEGLQQGWIVILDTMMTMYSAPVQNVLPENVKEAFKINIWVHRNDLITEDESLNRLGMSLKQQIEVYEGSSNVMNCFRENIFWTDLISLTEKKDLNDVKINQSHLSFSFGKTGIKNHILNHMFNIIQNIYNYNKTIWRIPLLDDTMNYTLPELLHILYINDGTMNGIQQIKNFFSTYAYRVIQPFKETKYQDRLIGIKYIDGINNIWKPKWAREARGRFYYLTKEKVIPLKDALQRGIEVLTKAHTDVGIVETQDIDSRTIEKVDSIQAETIKAFSGYNDYNAYLTGKVDGSLLIINHYPKTSEQYDIMKKVIMEVGDEFSKIICKHCEDNDLPLITVSTQGTILIGDEMQDYFLTSLQSLIDFEFTDVHDTWKRICPVFVSKVIDFLSICKLDNVNHMCFESYCKNRRSLTGVLHTELAIGYDHNGFNLLGIMSDNKYIPHFDLPEKIFKQPVYLKIKNTREVFDIMRDMDNVVLDKMKKIDFMEKYFPSKLDYPIHMEGWVLLTPQDIQYDYSKIKTSLYYKCHKIRDKNIDELLKLPLTCREYYPIIKILADFYENSEGQLVKSIDGIYDELNKNLMKHSSLYNLLNEKAKKRVDEFLDNPNDKSRETVYKILINNCQEEMVKIIHNVNKEIWNNNSDELASFMKGLIMKVEPWKGKQNNRYTKLDEMLKNSDEFMNSLFNIFFNEAA